MHFKAKIFLAALGILMVALLLNALLSISFFERLYTRSLTSVLEAGGENLQQKIQRGIRMGKPLDAYEGMPKMLNDFLSRNPWADHVAIVSDQGEVLYVEGLRTSATKRLSPQALKGLPRSETRTNLHQGNYLMSTPLEQPDGTPLGAVLISFAQDTILDKIMSMATGTLARLGWVLGPAAVVLMLLLSLCVFRPIKISLATTRSNLLPFMDAHACGQNPSSPNSPGQTNRPGPPNSGKSRSSSQTHSQTAASQKKIDPEIIRNEIRQLGAFLHAAAQELQTALSNMEDMLNSSPELERLRAEIDVCGAGLTGLAAENELPEQVHQELQELARENEALLVLIDELRVPGRGQPEGDLSRKLSRAGFDTNGGCL